MAEIDPLPESFYRQKVAGIAREARRLDADAVLLLDPHNVVYASGFFHSPNERPIGLLIPAEGDPCLFVPLLEKEHAEENWVGDVRLYAEFPGLDHPVRDMIRASGARRLVVDTLEARLFESCRDLVDSLMISDAVERLRFVKEPEELALVRAAAGYADLVLEAILADGPGLIRRGGTEIDLLAYGLGTAQAAMKRELEAFSRTKCGLVGTVHSGARAALPHGKTLPRIPRGGETLIAGIGASVGGYHAESGATFILGSPSPDQLSCLEAAEASDLAGRAALVPGVSCTAVNDAALAPIREAGFGAFIRHRIGHGMGVQGHEAPWARAGDETPVAEGMVFSSEPGIYRPGVDGYRTINTMIVGPAGVEVPSRFLATHPIGHRVLAL